MIAFKSTLRANSLTLFFWATVGARHAKMGVNSSFFPFLGTALVYSMQKDIGKEMTEEHVEAWEEVYDAISGEIVKAILNSSSGWMFANYPKREQQTPVYSPQFDRLCTSTIHIMSKNDIHYLT